MLRRMARDVVQAEIAPDAAGWAREGAAPARALSTLAELGLFGVMAPEADGGAGMDALALVVVLEELAVGDGGLATLVASHAVACEHLRRAGATAPFSGLATGAVRAAWAGGGTDARVAYARAVRAGAGWSLDGQLRWLPGGATADLIVAVVATGAEAGTAFALRGGEGHTVEAAEPLGLWTSAPAHLTLRPEVPVPDDARVGGVGAGYEDELAALPLARLARAAIAVGIGRAALEAGVSYAAERTQFGKPLTSFQAVQWMIADSATELDAARLLVWRGAHLLAAGEAAPGEAAMARLYAVRAARGATDRALQMHGGYGYTTDYPVERLWRDAKQCEVGEGSSPALHQRLVAEDLIAAARA